MTRSMTAAFSVLILTGLTIATAETLIGKGNDTCYEDDLKIRCPELENFDYEGQCESGFMKLNLKVVRVVRNAEPNRKCAKVSYNITCSGLEEKQSSRFNQELCRLRQKGVTNDERQHIVRFKLNETNDYSQVETDHGVLIQGSAGFENLHWLMATVKSKGGSVTMVDQNGTLAATYDNFYVSQNSTMTVISTYNENATEAPVTFNITIPMNSKPLFNLSSEVRIIDIERKCSFLNETADKWDGSTCKTLTSSNNQTICSCDHNSAFVVVFAVQEVEIAPELMWASTALEIASIVFLLVAAIFIGVYRARMNFDRVLVQINLCVGLMLTHLFFVLGPVATANEILCKGVTVAAHYFLVATACLMVIDGALMLAKILAPNSFNSGAKRRRFAGFFMAWGLPLIYVAVCSIIGFQGDTADKKNNYVRFWIERGSYDYCWINPKYNVVVIAPVGLALAINIVIAIKLGLIVWEMSKSAEQFKPTHSRDVNKASHAGKALRAVFILMPILGIPWLIGFFINLPKPFAMIFATIHVVVNSLQGVLLFLHYVPFNSEMRAEIRRSWKNTVSSIATVTPTVHFTTNRSESGVGLKDD